MRGGSGEAEQLGSGLALLLPALLRCLPALRDFPAQRFPENPLLTPLAGFGEISPPLAQPFSRESQAVWSLLAFPPSLITLINRIESTLGECSVQAVPASVFLTVNVFSGVLVLRLELVETRRIWLILASMDVMTVNPLSFIEGKSSTLANSD